MIDSKLMRWTPDEAYFVRGTQTQDDMCRYRLHQARYPVACFVPR